MVRRSVQDVKRHKIRNTSRWRKNYDSNSKRDVDGRSCETYENESI